MHTPAILRLALMACPREFRENYAEQLAMDLEQKRPDSLPLFMTCLNVFQTGVRLRFEMLQGDLMYAMRMLSRSISSSVVVILTLAIAVGVNTVVFAGINAVLIRPLPLDRPDQLYFVCYPFSIGSTHPSCNASVFPAAEVGAILRLRDAFRDVAALQVERATVRISSIPQSRTAVWASPSLFRLLRARPEAGRLLNDSDGRSNARYVVISDRLWRDNFSSRYDVLGKTVLVDGLGYEIVGVTKKDFALPDPSNSDLRTGSADLFLSLPSNPALWTGHEMPGPVPLMQAVIVARLRDGSEVAAKNQLERNDLPFRLGLLRTLHVRSLSGVPDPTLISLKYWYASFNDVDWLLMLALAAALSVLVIACVNVANLLLARGVGRRGELAMRNALGATRSRIIKQLITETTLLVGMSAALGVSFGYVTLHALSAVLPVSLSVLQNTRIDAPVLGFALAVSLAAVCLGGLFPAVVATKHNIVDDLRARNLSETRNTGRLLRSVLIVAEIAVAFSVVVCAVLLIRSFIAMVERPLGFDPRNTYITAISLPPTQYPTVSASASFAQTLASRLKAIPSVENLAISRGTTYLLKNLGEYGPDHSIGVTYPGSAGPTPSMTVTPGYFATLRIAVRSGRDFTAADRQGTTPVIIVDEQTARRFFGVNAVGKHLPISATGATQKEATIVGVVSAVQPSTGMATGFPYAPFYQFPASRFEISIRTRIQDSKLREEVASVVASIDHSVALQRFDSLADQVAENESPLRASMELFTALGIIALLLAIVGVYSVSSHLVGSRRSEFAVRRALGAKSSQLLSAALLGAILLGVIGVCFGVVLAMAAANGLSGLLLGTSRFDLLSFTVVSVLLIIISILASLGPTVKVLRTDPATTLRTE